MTRGSRLTILALGALVCVAATSASAQIVVGGSKASVEVNWDVLDRLGPEPTLPGLLINEPPAAGAPPAAAAKPHKGAAAASKGVVFKPYKAEAPEKEVRHQAAPKAKAAAGKAKAKPVVAKAEVEIPEVPKAPIPVVVPEVKPVAPKVATVAPKADEMKPVPVVQPAKPQRPEIVAVVPEPPKPPKQPAVAKVKTPPALPEVTPPPAPPPVPVPVPVVKVQPPPAPPAPPPVPVVKAPPPPPAPPAPPPVIAVAPPPPPPPVVAVAPPPPPPPPPVVAVAPPVQVASLPPAAATGGSVSRKGDLVSVVFSGESAQMPDSAHSEMDRIAQRMGKDEALSLQLVAYASGDEANASKARRLSLSRALELRKYLMELGVRSTRIEVRALGNKTDGGAADRVDAVLAWR